MKFHSLPVKRRPAKKGIFRTLSAVTRTRRQNVAAAATAYDYEEDDDEGDSKVSRSLIIIFLFHIVLIGMIFVHYRYLKDRSPEITTPSSASVSNSAPRPQAAVNAGQSTHVAVSGQDYPEIAIAYGVDETELRSLNQNIPVRSGSFITIPAPKPAPPAATTPDATPQTADQTNPPAPATAKTTPKTPAIPAPTAPELVPAIDVSHAPKAITVKSTTLQPNPSQTNSAATSYTVKPGDNLYQIAKRNKVTVDAILQTNRIASADAKKIRPGMKLTIPKK